MTGNSNLPPAARTPVWQRLTVAARHGEFILQVCERCSRVQYPPREVCAVCLHDTLNWEPVSARGKLLSATTLHASTNAFFRAHLPRQVALVKLDCGPLIFAHMAEISADTGAALTLVTRQDRSGEAVFVALLDAVDAQQQLERLQVLFA